MSYEYSGYLSTILYKPDADRSNAADSILFTAEDLAKWKTIDLAHTIEWRKVRVKKSPTDTGIQLEGDFRHVVGIDSFSPDDPRYWVALSTVGLHDDRFPIDTEKYPIIEVTYRCTSEFAHPIWMWTYEGGSHFGALPKSEEWHTVARNVQHFGFPKHIDDVILRLYSGRRHIESMEFASVRFRAMSEEEAEVANKSQISLNEKRQAKRFPILDEFMPLGVYMDASSAKRLANLLNITDDEYWDFVVEDLVAHNHNAIALAHAQQLNAGEWKALLDRCEAHGIRLVTRHEYPFDGSEEEQQAVIDKEIRPYADSNAILARTFSGEPIESNFLQVLEAKEKIEAADPNHPVAIIARYPNAYPLFAPFFAASGVGHFASRRPWDAGKVVRSHVPLSDAQQFWLAAPAFVYPTQTPEWCTCPEMRLMENLAFANGARGWFAYSYHNDPVWRHGRLQRTLTGPFLTFSDLWSECASLMKWADAMAPLYLQTRIEDEMDHWFIKGVSTESVLRPTAGVQPISKYHLRGPDFSLYITISNNLREIAGVNFTIPESVSADYGVYDLSQFIMSQHWEPMPHQRHIEMFPGQAHIMLVASPECCAHWRHVITQRMIQSDLRKLHYDLRLARTYDLDVAEIENHVGNLGDDATPGDISIVHAARDAVTDQVYNSAAIAPARSKILATKAAVCGCDGALCRLMEAGLKDRATELGEQVIPLTQAFTKLRLELKNGNGAGIYSTASALEKKTLELLRLIRSEYPHR